jgi:hypothetical protein
MPIPILTAAIVWRKLFPVIREIFKATRKKSAGGKKITPRERRQIIEAALPKIGAILDRELGG